MIFLHNHKKYKFQRYPKTRNKSLRSWNAGDEYILRQLEDVKLDDKHLLSYHDRFGFFNCVLNDVNLTTVSVFKSQEKAIVKNLEINQLPTDNLNFINPFKKPGRKADLALVKVPKSIHLFEFYLQHLSKHLKKNGKVFCGFMTRHFTKQLLEIAEEYFESVEQTKAWKKSRLLILKQPRPTPQKDLIRTIKLDNDKELQQYPGVFSSNSIDPATQFLIDNLNLQVKDKTILDLGCGNGVLTHALSDIKSNGEYHLIDDFFLAVESAKMNLQGDNFHFHYNDDLKIFDNRQFDYIVSNPPFHFEHENNIEVSLDLFHQSARILKNNAHFQIVANKHLNYLTHLEKYFTQVDITAENEKYIIYECWKIEQEEDPSEDQNFNI